MNLFSLVLLILTLALAAANGANDVSKGVATLAGAGVTRYRTAILWGAATTMVGSLLSLSVAGRLTKLFSAGIVAAPPTFAFTAAVLLGAIVWVGFATVTHLPVSTTHAIVGSLIGTGIVFAPGAIHWSVLLGSVGVPLLASVIASYVLSAGLNLLRFGIPECTCLEVIATAPVPLGSPPLMAATPGVPLPVINVMTGREADCRVHGTGVTRIGVNVTGMHWLTSGATSVARGLNDTPKIVAIGALALPTLGIASSALLVAVAAAMALGGLIGGMRVARVLGDKVVQMTHAEGFKANLTTALLVGMGAHLGLPMSTTHVATGAITGLASTKTSRLNRRLLRDFALAWTVTPLVAGLVAATVFAIIRSSSGLLLLLSQ